VLASGRPRPSGSSRTMKEKISGRQRERDQEQHALVRFHPKDRAARVSCHLGNPRRGRVQPGRKSCELGKLGPVVDPVARDHPPRPVEEYDPANGGSASQVGHERLEMPLGRGVGIATHVGRGTHLSSPLAQRITTARSSGRGTRKSMSSPESGCRKASLRACRNWRSTFEASTRAHPWTEPLIPRPHPGPYVSSPTTGCPI
jgi:hypothetical protein